VTLQPSQFGNNGYTDAHRAVIGKRGDWKSLGLPAGRDIPADPPTPKTGIAEARERLKKSESIINPLGETLRMDEETYTHLSKKGRKQKEIQNRLAELDAARVTMENPHEIWRDEKRKRNVYIRMTTGDNGKLAINAVSENNGHVLSWHKNSQQFDYFRKGRFVYVRK